MLTSPRAILSAMNYFYGDLASVPFLHPLGVFLIPFIVVVLAWTIVIKGFALWHAARGNDKIWFIFLLVANTLGVVEVIYLVWFRKDKDNSKVAEVPPAA